MGGVKASHFDANGCLDGVFSVFNEVCFLEPPFRGGIVGHQEGAIAVGESSHNNADPWGYNHCRMFEKIVRCMELKFWQKVEMPCKTLVAETSKPCWA